MYKKFIEGYLQVDFFMQYTISFWVSELFQQLEPS